MFKSKPETVVGNVLVMQVF